MKRVLLLTISLSGALAHAQLVGPSSFTYEGRVLEGGSPSGASVHFVLRLLDPAGTCIIYEERIGPKNLADSNGYFSVSLGDGTRAAPNASAPVRALITNTTAVITGLKTADSTACTYSPATGDSRRLRVIIDDGTTPVALSPDITLGTSPYAMVADTLRGFEPSQFILQNADTTQAKADTLFNSTNWPLLQALLAGTSTNYVKTSSNNTSTLPTHSTDPASPTAGQIWYDSATNSVKYYNGSAVQNLGGSSTPLVESNIPTLAAAGKVSGSAIISGTIGGSTAINTSGPITSSGVVSATDFIASNTTTTKQLKVLNSAGTKKATLQSHDSMAADYTLTLPLADGSNGQVLTTDGSGQLFWSVPGGGSGITTVTASAPLAVSGGISPNISLASGTTSGQALRWDGSSWAPTFLTLADLRSSTIPTNTMFPATSCFPGETLTWSSLTDTMTCSPIAISASAITSGVIASARLPIGTSASTVAAGDDSRFVWQANSGNAYLDAGNVGVGTMTPSARIQANQNSSSVPAFLANADGQTRASIQFSKDGIPRWQMRYDSAGESSANLGGNLMIIGHADAGSQFSYPWFVLQRSNGNLGLGGVMNPTFALTFNGDSPRTVGIERNQSGAGKDLILEAGGANASSVDTAGGKLVLSGGISKGNGGSVNSSAIVFQTAPNAGSGSSDNVPSTRMIITQAGHVGIGTAAPEVKLHVAGAIVSKTNSIPSGNTVDLSVSNTHVLASVNASSFNLTNMTDGGSYTLIVTDVNPRTYTFPSCNNSFFKPANGPTASGQRTIYGVLTVFNGSGWDCYINWTTGYQ